MSEPRWLDAEEQRTWRTFLSATQTLFEALDRQLQRDSGMPLAYYDILVQLSEVPDRALRMSQLAERVGASPSRLSHAVARLEARGWLTRSECPTDRRGQFAVLTEAGYDELAAAAPGHVEMVRRLLLDPLRDEQVGQLRAISEAILSEAGSAAPSGEPADPGHAGGDGSAADRR